MEEAYFDSKDPEKLKLLASYHEKGLHYRTKFKTLEDLDKWANILSLQPMPVDEFLQRITGYMKENKAKYKQTLAALKKLNIKKENNEKVLVQLQLDLDYEKLEKQKELQKLVENAKVDFVKALGLHESAADLVKIEKVSKGSVVIILCVGAGFLILVGLCCGYYAIRNMDMPHFSNSKFRLYMSLAGAASGAGIGLAIGIGVGTTVAPGPGTGIGLGVGAGVGGLVGGIAGAVVGKIIAQKIKSVRVIPGPDGWSAEVEFE